MAKALLIIDMLRDFIDEDGALYIGKAGELVQNVAVRIKEQRSSGGPILYIMDQHLPGDAEFEMFPPHCLLGKRGSEVIEALAPQAGEFLIPKRRYSAFFGTDLDLTLRELGVTELELAGVCTNICVLYTAADARMLNYKVTVHRNCVASFDPEAHAFALKEMEQTLGVNILP